MDINSCGSVQIVLAECKLDRKESISKVSHMVKNMNGDRKSNTISRCGC